MILCLNRRYNAGMKILSLLFLILCLCCSNALAQKCLDSAQEIVPQLTKDSKRDLELKLIEARRVVDLETGTKKQPSADNLIWFGRRTAYLGHYKDAIKIFTRGIEDYPEDPRFYRHRGHRLITLRCFDDAIIDFKKAVKLIKGKPDEIEPDGMPNARNIPTSTLQSNIWYHLGLAQYLKGDFGAAYKSYVEGEKVSTNPDMLVANTHWMYMTLRRMGRDKDAQQVIAKIKSDVEVIENGDYLKLIRLYQGTIKAEDLLKEISGQANSLSNASVGYGLGNWYLYNKQKDEAEKIFRQMVMGNQWASFGFIAAESELKK